MKVTKEILTKEIEAAERDIEHEKYKTALKKTQFINEIKNGLGTEIKKNTNKITIIKRPWYYKLGQFIKKIFTKF